MQAARSAACRGASSRGVHFAMDFLDAAEPARRPATWPPTTRPSSPRGKRVVVLGGGDTGSDCVGTSLRQGAAHVTSLELMPRPPDDRADAQSVAAVAARLSHVVVARRGRRARLRGHDQALVGDEQRPRHARSRRCASSCAPGHGPKPSIPGSEFDIPCDLVLLAMGFVGPVNEGLLEQLGVALDARGNVATTNGRTSVDGVFAAGDMARGQSLVVWAIAEGRKVAARRRRLPARCRQAPPRVGRLDPSRRHGLPIAAHMTSPSPRGEVGLATSIRDLRSRIWPILITACGFGWR